MKLGFIPETMLERVMLWSGKLPVPMGMTFACMAMARISTACARTGIFEYLARHRCTPAELASALNLDLEATTRVLHCLVAGGTAIQDGEHFMLVPSKAHWYDADSPNTVIHALKHFDDLWNMWSNLPEILEKGARPEIYQAMLRQQESEIQWGTHDEAQIRRHLEGLGDMARLQCQELMLRFRPPRGAGKVLDIGGGHCQYLIGILKARPEYTGVDFDLPLPSTIGRDEVAKAGMGDRIRVVAGDLFADDLEATVGSDFSMVLYFNILHNLSEAQNRRALDQILKVMKKGGKLYLWDMYRRESGIAVGLGAIFSLQMLMGASGTTYTVPEVSGWLRDAGYSGIRTLEMRSVPGSTVIIAERPQEALVRTR